MNRNTLSMKSLCLSALALLFLTPVVASAQNDQKTNENKQDKASKRQSQQDSTSQRSSQKSESFQQALDELNLSQQEMGKIRNAVRKYDRQMNQLFTRFQQVHARAIGLEAAMVAAVADQLSEEQKQQFKRKDQRQETEEEATEEPTGRKRRGEKSGKKESDQTAPQKGSQKSEQKAEQKNTDQKSRETRRERRQAARAQEQRAQSDADAEQDQGLLIVAVRVRPVRERYARLGLSPQQKAKCDAVCMAYENQLKPAWKQLYTIHNQMVLLEAKKLEEIESYLSTQQLQKLHDLRERPASQKGARKGEQDQQRKKGRATAKETEEKAKTGRKDSDK